MRNPEEYAEKHVAEHIASPEDAALAEGEPPHNTSLTEVAAEALRSGLYPVEKDEEVPGQDDVLRAGDPDIDPLGNLYSGDELPGGSMPTPDQNNVDDAGRAAGLGGQDTGELHSSEELMSRRDTHRWE
jgi:hypothetical protein